MILKIEGQGSAELEASTIVAFEEIKENMVEARPGAKASVFFDIGEGIQNHIVENNYDQVKGNAAANGFQEIILSGKTSRRMSIPRNSIIYKEDFVNKDEEELEGEPPKTFIKVRLGTQIITLATTLTRDELNMG